MPLGAVPFDLGQKCIELSMAPLGIALTIHRNSHEITVYYYDQLSKYTSEVTLLFIHQLFLVFIV